MLKKTHPKLKDSLSPLGMGNMRLPQVDGKIDYPRAEAMIDYLMENGINYYDTAYFYHNGESEGFVRQALIRRYPRDQFYLADKLPVGIIETEEDVQRIFDLQMERLGTDVIDYHLLHALNKKNWEKAKNLGMVEFQRGLKERGIARHIGFSFHDSPDVLEQILDEGKWDFVQLQINYLDWHHDDAKQLYDSCLKRDLPIIVMEPIRGGGLAQFHTEIESIFKADDPDASLASWALRWVKDLPQVIVTLSGMSEMSHCIDNIKTYNIEDKMSSEDLSIIHRALAALKKLPTVPCTDCKYCDDCPEQINIPGLFSLYNDYLRFGQVWRLSQSYLRNTEESKQASACIECGLCESVCPQRIEIISEIARIHSEAIAIAAG